jgi:hypothetical protein
MVSFLMVVKFLGILPEERKELEADWGNFTTPCQYAESGISSMRYGNDSHLVTGADDESEHSSVVHSRVPPPEGAPLTAPSLGIDSDHGQARKGERRE